jgi:hypothetical protein
MEFALKITSNFWVITPLRDNCKVFFGFWKVFDRGILYLFNIYFYLSGSKAKTKEMPTGKDLNNLIAVTRIIMDSRNLLRLHAR